MSTTKASKTYESWSGTVKWNGGILYAPKYYTELRRSRIGNDLPSYKQIILDGGNATTRLYAEQMTLPINIKPGKATGLYKLGGGQGFYSLEDTYVGYEVPPFLTTVSEDLKQEALAQARTHALKRVHDLQRPFQAQIFTGELRETIQLLRHPLETWIKLAKQYNVMETLRDYRYAAKLTASAHLELRFGVLPLVSDVSNILALIRSESNKEKHVKQRTYGKAEKSVVSVYDKPTTYGDILTRVESTQIQRVECFIHFGLMWEKIHQLEGLTANVEASLKDLREVPSTIWELTYLSWLVDYFVNVGDIIETATVAQSAVSYSSESVVRTTENHLKVISYRPKYTGGVVSSYSNFKVSGQLPYVVAKWRQVNRVGGALAIPPVVFHFPGSNIKYLNIAALLAQRKL